MAMRRGGRTAMLVAVVLSVPVLAHANATEDTLGAGHRVRGMGGAGTALASDYSAVYYNPANLPMCPTSTMTVGYEQVQYKLSIDDRSAPAPGRDRPPGYPRRERLRPLHDYTVGACGKLPLNLGAGVLFTQGVQNPAFLLQSTTDGRPRFALYGQRLENLSLMAGLGPQPTPH